MEERNERPEIKLPSNGDPKRKPVFPGLFPRNIRKTISSNQAGFPNAKPASMLERGFVKKSDIKYLRKGNSGLLVLGSREIEVSVEEGMHKKDDVWVFTFKDTSNKLFDIPYAEPWDFYTPTTPVPFVPRQRKTRKQRGGFYHSVYRGIAGATMLTPLIARQMMRMYETANKTRKHKSKKLSRNKRA